MSLGLSSIGSLHTATLMTSGLCAATSTSSFSADQLSAFNRLTIAEDHRPDYPGGPLGTRHFNGQVLTPIASPRASIGNVLLINSGGDSRGYNCINYGAYLELTAGKLRVFGSMNGFAGLTNPRPQIIELNSHITSQLAHEGHLLLATGSRRCGPYDQIPGLAQEAPLNNFMANIAPFLGGLLVVGGDGTLQLCQRLVKEAGIKNLIFAGASMDGDIPGMESSIGMDSSLDYVVGAIRSIQRTSGSCNKVHIIQTMGGNSGRFPLEAAHSAGIRAVIVPELGTIDMQYIYRLLFKSLLENRGAVLVIGEKGSYRTMHGEKISFAPQKGSMNGKEVEKLRAIVDQEMNEVAATLYPDLKISTRTNILGHAQRQPGKLAQIDLREGMDMGRRMVRALLGGDEGMIIPMDERDPMISIDDALSENSRQAGRTRVLKRWLDNFGPFYPELTDRLRERESRP